MASFKIEEFRVRHGGEHSRYAAVFTDENGNVSVQPVPGKPFPNLCVSGYAYNYRTYPSSVPSTPAADKTRSLITEYCNLDTFTNYRIYAQDCTPFAYAETDLNAPKCGYQQPTAEPANPPNPYGTLKYQNYKYTEFCNDKGETVRLDILRKFAFIQSQTYLQVDTFVKPGSNGPITIKVFIDRLKHLVSFTGSAQNDLGSNRIFAPNDLITEICDYETGTNLKIYAQTNAPFAYIIEEPDSLTCSVPVVEPEFIENWGDEPIILSTKGDDKKYNQFYPTECQINLLCTEDFGLEEFYTNDEREFKVIVTVEGQTRFEGFIIPDSCSEPFLPAPYEVSIRATDSLGALKNITYPIPFGSKIDLKQSFLQIIAFCLASTNLTLNIRTIVNIYETKMLNGLNDDPLNQSFVNPLRFTGNNGNVLNSYDVLEEVLKLFNASIRQYNGEWVIFRIDELASEVSRSRVYNNKAFFLFAEIINPIREISNMTDEGDFPFSMDQFTTIGNPYKRASVLTEYAQIPSLIFNGDFEQWDGQNFAYWTKYGGMDIERTQKTTVGAGGALIPIEDYTCLFKERANSGKWLESNPIAVIQGDTIQLSFNYYIFFVGTAALKLRIKIGDFYLTNSNNTLDYVWTKSLSTCTIGLKSTFDIFNPTQARRATISINMPDAPQTGVMILQLFGPQGYDYIPQNATYQENNQYTPLDIDNISVTRKSKFDSREAEGTKYISDQQGFYTQKADLVKILFGDYVPKFNFFIDFNVVNGSNVYEFINPTLVVDISGTQTTTPLITDNLHAIYTSDLSYSTTWYEYGTTSGRLPIGLILSKSIIKSYQKPFRYISGSFYAKDFGALNTFRFVFDCIPNFSQKIFAPLSFDINLKSNTITNVNMVEIFDKYIKTSDSSGPSYPGDVDPPISNNPNTPPINPTFGIFTDEFTTEFK